MAISRLPILFWWRKLSKKDLITAAVGLALIFFSYSFLFNNSPDNNAPDFTLNSHSDYVPLTLLSNAKHRGAFCLDGSLPGYHFRQGFGSGSNNWVLHIEGGGWCDSVVTCALRKTTPLGSSNHMEQVQFSGILSHNQAQNPGCSAGGLATMIHCDDFRAKLPNSAIVKCLADASFFLDEEDINGRRTMQLFYKNVVNLHGASKSLPKDCVDKMDPSLCFFPRQIIQSIKTPIFLVNPAYDFWQIQHVLVPAASDVSGEWRRCRLNIQKCNSHQMDILQGFRNSLLNAIHEFDMSKERGMSINSCFIHCQTWMETWHGLNSPKVNNKTIAEAVGDWYFNRGPAMLVDCPFPCNPSCLNMDFLRA